MCCMNYCGHHYKELENLIYFMYLSCLFDRLIVYQNKETEILIAEISLILCKPNRFQIYS